MIGGRLKIQASLAEFCDRLKAAKEPQISKDAQNPVSFVYMSIEGTEITVNCSNKELKDGMNSLSDEQKSLLSNKGFIQRMM